MIIIKSLCHSWALLISFAIAKINRCVDMMRLKKWIKSAYWRGDDYLEWFQIFNKRVSQGGAVVIHSINQCLVHYYSFSLHSRWYHTWNDVIPYKQEGIINNSFLFLVKMSWCWYRGQCLHCARRSPGPCSFPSSVARHSLSEDGHLQWIIIPGKWFQNGEKKLL